MRDFPALTLEDSSSDHRTLINKTFQVTSFFEVKEWEKARKLSSPPCTSTHWRQGQKDSCHLSCYTQSKLFPHKKAKTKPAKTLSQGLGYTNHRQISLCPPTSTPALGHTLGRLPRSPPAASPVSPHAAGRDSGRGDSSPQHPLLTFRDLELGRSIELVEAPVSRALARGAAGWAGGKERHRQSGTGPAGARRSGRDEGK